jgi:hypothetical protein
MNIQSWELHRFKTNKKVQVKRVNAPPCFSGLESTIRAILGLYSDLKSEGSSYLLTSRINQDPLENMFRVIRQRGAYNANPMASQFRRNLQHVISVHLMSPPDSSNCEPDEEITVDFSSHVTLTTPNKSTDTCDTPPQLEPSSR